MRLYAKIRRMYFREHTSINQITRKTSLSRKPYCQLRRFDAGR